MDANELASALLNAYEAQLEVPDGLAFDKALQQARLDYPLQSLERIDQLLAQIRLKLKPQAEGWLSDPAKCNFLLLLAFYIGTVVSRHGQAPLQWYTYAEALAVLPPQARPPEASWSRALGLMGEMVCLPLGFDGYANLPTGRTDALTIDLRCYAGGLLWRRKALSLKITCPYRHASQPGGFALYSPKVVECSVPTDVARALFRPLYQGIDDFKSTTFSWNRYLDESV